MAKDSLAHIHPATSEYVFFSILAAWICMKRSASRPKTPSMATTSGINDACPVSAASLYFLFFSSSADDRIEATSLFENDRASVSMTRKSNNATV